MVAAPLLGKRAGLARPAEQPPASLSSYTAAHRPRASPCTRRPGTWQLQPFAALSAGSAAGRLLPPAALRLLRQAHLSQLVVGSIALQATQAGGAQILRVLRLAGTKQVREWQ